MTKNLEGERTELTAGGEKMTRFSRRQSPFGLHHHHPPGRGRVPMILALIVFRLN
jgi:hypothetical protein